MKPDLFIYNSFFNIKSGKISIYNITIFFSNFFTRLKLHRDAGAQACKRRSLVCGSHSENKKIFVKTKTPTAKNEKENKEVQ